MSFSAVYNVSGRSHHVAGAMTGEAGRRCALQYNPTGDAITDRVKVAFASTMQTLIHERDTTTRPGKDATAEEMAAYSDKMRCIATALTDLEKAQMMGVKALHTRANAGVKS